MLRKSKRVTFLLVSKVVMVAGLILSGIACDHKPAADAQAIGPVLRVNAAQDPQSLDPAKLIDTETSVFVTAQFAPLCLIGANDSIIPILAESADLAADGRSIRIRLRHNALFSDGTPVRSSDVRFSF